MDNNERAERGLAELRKPFAADQIQLLPKPTKKDSERGKCSVCGGFHGLPAFHLEYVGHAAATNRLLDADATWSWEPLALENGLPKFDAQGGLWIKLTVCGVTRLGYGDSAGKTGNNAIKEAIGDAIRNAAMRFGCAIDLWHKGEEPLYDGRGVDLDGYEPPENKPSAPAKQVVEQPKAKQPEEKKAEAASQSPAGAAGSEETPIDQKQAASAPKSGDKMNEKQIGVLHKKMKAAGLTNEDLEKAFGPRAEWMFDDFGAFLKWFADKAK